MHDTDDLIPLRLVVPSQFRTDPRDERRARRTPTATAIPTSATASRPPTSSTCAGRTRPAPQAADSAVKGRLMIAAMAVGATAAGALLDDQRRRQAPARDRAGRRAVDDRRRRRHHRLDGRHADRHRHARRQLRGARRGDHQGRRVRAGACRARSAAAAAAVRDADQGRVHLRASATAGACCTAASTSPTRSAPRSCAAADGVVIDAGPDRRLRRLGQAPAFRRHRHAVRPRQHLDWSASASG